MAFKEKGGPAESRQIPKIIPRQEYRKFITTQRDLQVERLTARFGFVVETAAVIAALAWGVAR